MKPQPSCAWAPASNPAWQLLYNCLQILSNTGTDSPVVFDIVTVRMSSAHVLLSWDPAHILQQYVKLVPKFDIFT